MCERDRERERERGGHVFEETKLLFHRLAESLRYGHGHTHTVSHPPLPCSANRGRKGQLFWDGGVKYLQSDSTRRNQQEYPHATSSVLR